MGEIGNRFGRLDILVANAGIAIIAPITEMTLEAWRKQTAVNIDGTQLVDLERGDDWHLDPRVPADEQAGPERCGDARTPP